MIPVLIAPAYNRHDLLLRMLKSIDVRVERGIIIDSARNIWQSDLWPQIQSECERLNLISFTPPFSSMGYGGGINFSIMQTFDAPWWMWSSNDVQFLPGHLQTVIDRMGTSEPRVVTGGFTWGALNRGVIESVGLIDEHSFFPIYYDDNDYQYRCKVAGVDWVEDWNDGTIHGDAKVGASLTILSDPKIMEKNHRTFTANTRAYLEKWGGMPREETFSSPWNSSLPVWATKPSVNGRRDRQW